MKQVVGEQLIYKVICGSYAYGTNKPTSDFDYAGIFIPDVEYFLGLQAFDMVNEQAEADLAYYSLRKFANLAIGANPNVLELLFVHPDDVLKLDAVFQPFLDNRKLFLSQRCRKTFVGYAKAQLSRIRNHQKWLEQERRAMAVLEPAAKTGQISRGWVAWRFGTNMLERVERCMDRIDLSLGRGPEFRWNDTVTTRWNQDDTAAYILMDNAFLPQLGDSGIVCPDQNDDRFWVDKPKGLAFQKHLYDEAKKKRDQYVTWMAERNPDRHKSELQFGYDTKHAMHLVRLLRCGFEVLTTGELNVRRPDAQELLAIRDGAWSYEQVISYADAMVKMVDESAAVVPEDPDIKKISKLVIDVTKEVLVARKQI